MDLFFLKVGLTALTLSLLLGIFSFVVYFFRLAFLSIAVSHAVLAGLAVGIFLGINPIWSALIFSLLIGWFIALLRKKVGLSEDASIGIVLALSMAGGIILIYLSGYQGNLFAYLFGSLLTVSWSDFWSLLILGILTLTLFWKYKEQILFLCFDEETAYSAGINTDLLYYLLVGFLSFLITYTTKLVGVILTHAMLVIPTATAFQLAWHYGELLARSGLVSVVSTFGGLIFAYLFNLPTGPSIVLIGGSLFLAAYLIGKVKSPRGARGIFKS